MKPPLTLRVKSPEDAQEQLRMHRTNSLAHALITSSMHRPPVATSGVPYAAPKVDLRGSPQAGRISELRSALLENERALRETPALNWKRLAQLYDRCTWLRQQIEKTTAELDGYIGSGRSGGYTGLPNLYLLSVAAATLTQGDVTTEHARQSVTLNTHTLPPELRAALDAWCRSGREALPYRYRKEACRYGPESRCTPQHAELFNALENEISAHREIVQS